MESQVLRFDCLGVSLQVRLDVAERVISESLITSGAWEGNQLSLYADLIAEDGVFVDIGANVGINAMFAARIRPGCRVVAVEPSPENFARLAANIDANGCGNIDAHPVAIADRIGELGFVGSGTNAHVSLSEGGASRVACHTLDGFLADLRIVRIDLMKIDVEGYTDLVLSHSEQARRMARAAIVEFSHGDIGARIAGQGGSVSDHAEHLFEVLRRDFTHFYYISRHSGLVALSDTRDLFPIMALEAPVGDVLAIKRPMPGAVSAVSFLCGKVAQLMEQNHRRITDILALKALHPAQT